MQEWLGSPRVCALATVWCWDQRGRVPPPGRHPALTHLVN